MLAERGIRLSFSEAARAATELLRAVWVAGHALAAMEEDWPKGPTISYAELTAAMFPDWDESSLRHFRRDRRPPQS